MLLSAALSHAAALFLVLCVRRARALTNVTVDDQSPLIAYAPAGSWARINDSTTAALDVDGGHMLTSDPAATAVLNFTGVAVYFYSARWPYNVSSAVALDGGPAVLLDLTDHTRAATDGGPATVKAAVVGQAVGLLNVTHTLTVSVGAGQPFTVVDAIVYTALGAHDALPSSTNSTPPTQLTPVPPASTSTTPHKSHKSRNLAIALPIVFVLLFLLLLILLLLFLRRRRHARRNTAPASNSYPFPGAEHSPLGGARTMRNAYAEDGELGQEEKAGLRITNPDPAASPASLVGPAPPIIAMPAPAVRASTAPRDAGGDRDGDGDKQSALRSPGTYYGALRAMTHSPARAYPVPPARGGGGAPHQPWDSADADADMYEAEDSRPASRSVYSQVTAIGIEDGEDGGGRGGSALLGPHGAGRHRASGRTSGRASGYTDANSSARAGRGGYEAPLAYVPVFKS